MEKIDNEARAYFVNAKWQTLVLGGGTVAWLL
jgi:hypothetical protein